VNFLIIGGTGNLSEETVVRLIRKNHSVHCVTRGNNLLIESQLESLGVHFFHMPNINLLDFKLSKLFLYHYDFILDFVCYNATDIKSRLSIFRPMAIKAYVFISTTAFYNRISPRSFPHVEAKIDVTSDWDYAFSKFQAEQSLIELSNSLPFKTLTIRLGHTLGSSIPVYLGNPGLGYIDHLLSGLPIPFVGCPDNPWSIGTASGLASLLSFLPEVISSLPHNLTFHYTGFVTSWNELYSSLCSYLSIGNPVFKFLSFDEIRPIASDWMPSILYHKIYPDLYDCSNMQLYFPMPTHDSIELVVSNACMVTLARNREKSYTANLNRLTLLVSSS